MKMKQETSYVPDVLASVPLEPMVSYDDLLKRASGRLVSHAANMALGLLGYVRHQRRRSSPMDPGNTFRGGNLLASRYGLLSR